MTTGITPQHRPAQMRSRSASAVTLVLALVAAVTVSLVAAVTAPTPASAAARISISSPLGGVTVSADGPTPITVTGTGFQSVQGGFGGIYVFFGWVDGSGTWRPSQGGRTGADYLYVPDTEAKDNAGYQRFVTYPGSSTSDAANGGEVSADGRFSFDMVIPGPRFAAQDRNQNVQEVDCLQVTCGIITIGAHGVVNGSNETFTPVEFASPSGGSAGGSGTSAGSSDAGQQQSQASDATGGSQAAAAPQGAAAPNPQPAPVAPVAPATGVGGAQDGAGAGDDTAAAAGDGGEEATGTEDDEGSTAAAAAPATLGLDQSTIVAGRVLAFTGQGFAPGEQVMATLGGGHAVVGPLTAGEYGEVVGTFALDPELRAGTYVIRLSGAASGQNPQVDLTVVEDPAALGAAGSDQTSAQDPVWPWAFVIVVVLGSLLLLIILISLITTLRRRRAAKKAAAAAAAGGAADQKGADEAEDASDAAPAKPALPSGSTAAPSGADADPTAPVLPAQPTRVGSR